MVESAPNRMERESIENFHLEVRELAGRPRLCMEKHSNKTNGATAPNQIRLHEDILVPCGLAPAHFVNACGQFSSLRSVLFSLLFSMAHPPPLHHISVSHPTLKSRPFFLSPCPCVPMRCYLFTDNVLEDPERR